MGLLYLFNPHLFPADVHVDVVAGIGGVLGAGIHYYVSAATD